QAQLACLQGWYDTNGRPKPAKALTGLRKAGLVASKIRLKDPQWRPVCCCSAAMKWIFACPCCPGGFRSGPETPTVLPMMRPMVAARSEDGSLRLTEGFVVNGYSIAPAEPASLFPPEKCLAVLSVAPNTTG